MADEGLERQGGFVMATGALALIMILGFLVLAAKNAINWSRLAKNTGNYRGANIALSITGLCVGVLFFCLANGLL